MQLILTAQTRLLRIVGKLDTTIVKEDPAVCFQFANALPDKKLYKYLFIYFITISLKLTILTDKVKKKLIWCQ